MTTAPHPRWSKDRANAWWQAQPWPVGCNFLPSSAVNFLEMWMADSFDRDTIARELGLGGGNGSEFHPHQPALSGLEA